MKSVKWKLVIYFSGLMILFFVCYGTINYINASRILVNESKTHLSGKAEDMSKQVNSFVEGQIKELSTIASMLDTSDQAKVTQTLNLEAKRLKYNMILIADLTGTAHLPNGNTADISSRDYFKKALAGESNMSNPLISVVEGEESKLVLVVAVPINRGGQITGILVGQLNGDFLSKFAEESKFGSGGYATIVNEAGTIISDVNTQYIFDQFNPLEAANQDPSVKEYASIVSAAKDRQIGAEKYTFNNEIRYAAYAPIEKTGWAIIVSDYESEILGNLVSFKISTIIATLIALLLGVIFTYIIGKSISNPIMEVTKYSELVANLNVKENLPDSVLKQNDEIGILGRSFQSLVESLRIFINKVSDSAEQVETSSHGLSTITSQTAATSEEISRVVEEISKGSGEQSQMTQSGADMVQVLGNIIGKDLESLNQLNESSDNVVSLIQAGLEEVRNLTQKTMESAAGTKEIFEGIQKTNESSNKIGQVSGVIASIAEQTNLLALNAAIEAARAGERGKGFAVVADEIRKLAEQSTSSIKQIDSVVEELQENSGMAVEAMQRVVKLIQDQKESVNATENKFNMISKAISDSVEKIKVLNASSNEMADKKQEILEIMQNLAAIAEENAASTEEVSASVEEQTAAIDEISNDSENMKKLVFEMKSLVSNFQV